MTTAFPSSSVSVTVRELAAWTNGARTANDKIQQARMALATGDGLETGVTIDDVLMEAQEATEQIRATTAAAAGIHIAANPFTEIDIFQLDTSDTRALLALLEGALVVAERIDEARGRTVGANIEVQPGESRGTDLAEIIGNIAERLRREVHGARGRD